jgi:hypothetical protein
MSEWDEDQAELMQRLRRLQRLAEQGKKWADEEWMVEFRRLRAWQSDQHRRRDEARKRIEAIYEQVKS